MTFYTPYHRCVLAAVALSIAASASAGTEREIPALPSGMVVELQDLILEEKPDGVNNYARFRFIAPELSAVTPDYDTRLLDMQALCERYALKDLAERAKTADIIVISLSDRATAFGVANPDATQFFEAFRIKPSLSGGTCMVEDF